MDDMLKTPFLEHFLDLFLFETYFPIIRNAKSPGWEKSITQWPL